MLKGMATAAIGIAAFTMGVTAQTVTGSGTSGKVPVFTGTSAIGNSPISVSGSNVGIGSTAASLPLTVTDAGSGGVLVTGNNGMTAGTINVTNSAVSGGLTLTQGGPSVSGWAFVNNSSIIESQSSGGLDISAYNGGPITFQTGVRTARMVVNYLGNVGIGTAGPLSLLDIYNGQFLVRANDGGPNYGSGMRVGYDGTSAPALGFRVADQSERFKMAVVGSAINTVNERVSISGDCGGGCGMTEYLSVNRSGNVGIGSTAPGYKLDVAGAIRSSTGGVYYPDGTQQTTAWTGVVCGGDYAESVDVKGSRKAYEPGDVLVIGQEKGSDVAKSSEPYSTLVAGVYATKPGLTGRRQLTDAKSATTEVPMAMVGIVPTKVSAENGPIRRGDLLVTSSTPGYAMKGTDRNRLTGAVVGKALGSLDTGTGVIEVVVTLQ